MRLVVDASPLILLAGCGQLDLLERLADHVSVPQTVLAELTAGADHDATATVIRHSPWIDLVETPAPPTSIEKADLGAGETEVLSWSLLHSDIAVLDDRAARICALEHQLPIIGSLGIVLAAKERGWIPAARPIIEMLVDAGLYVTDRIVQRVLEQSGESPSRARSID